MAIALYNCFRKVQNQHVDFILRSKNDNLDFLTVEEKKSIEGVDADIKKGKLMQAFVLDVWKHKLRNKLVLLRELESISCQWKANEITIFGSKLLPSGKYLQYIKGRYQFPILPSNSADFAKLLMFMISLKRLVFLNYRKFNCILNSLNTVQIETLCSSQDSENSYYTSSEVSSYADDSIVEGDPCEEVLADLHQIKFDKHIKCFTDLEDLLYNSYRVNKKQRTQ